MKLFFPGSYIYFCIHFVLFCIDCTHAKSQMKKTLRSSTKVTNPNHQNRINDRSHWPQFRGLVHKPERSHILILISQSSHLDIDGNYFIVVRVLFTFFSPSKLIDDLCLEHWRWSKQQTKRGTAGDQSLKTLEKWA